GGAPALGQKLRAQSRQLAPEVLALLDTALGRQVVDHDRQKRREGCRRHLRVDAELPGHARDAVRPERARHLSRSDGLVLARRDPGVRLRAEPRVLELREHPVEPALTLDHARAEVHERTALLRAAADLTGEASENLVQHAHGKPPGTTFYREKGGRG